MISAIIGNMSSKALYVTVSSYVGIALFLTATIA